jgi:hypothetical protein
MNERIKQMITEHGMYHDSELYEIAEAVVLECSKVIVNGGYWTGGISGERRPCTPPEIAQMIKEHFGIRE